MCDICDGATFEESLANFKLLIVQYGWAMQSVHATADDPILPWTYTVGLLENYNHPELIIAGLGQTEAGGVITAMVEQHVQRGTRLRPGLGIDASCGCHYHFVGVHENRLGEDWFNTWFNVYDSVDEPTPIFEALQIVPCGHPDLDWMPLLNGDEVHFPVLDRHEGTAWNNIAELAQRPALKTSRRQGRGKRGCHLGS